MCREEEGGNRRVLISFVFFFGLVLKCRVGGGEGERRRFIFGEEV